MARVFLSLGSNLGDRLHYLQRAVDAIARIPSTKVITTSSVYETEPVGKKDQPEFLNAVAELQAGLDALPLFRALKEIERSLGRTKTERWGPREIDIDILYYDADIVKNPELNIPHSEIHNRRFVLVSIAEIDGEFLDPLTNESMKQILNRSTDESVVKRTSLALTIQP